MSDVSVETTVIYNLQTFTSLSSAFRLFLSMYLHIIPLVFWCLVLKGNVPTQWLQCYCGEERLRMSSRRPL